MSKRKRGKKRMDTPKTYSEIPIERIQELVAAGINEFRCKIFRRNEAGRLAALRTATLSADELLDIDQSVEVLAGGGRYFVQTYHPHEKFRKLVDFDFNIDGPQRSVQSAQMQPQNAPSAAGILSLNQYSQPSDDELAPFAVAARNMRINAPLTSTSSDAIALQQLEETRASQRRLEAQLEEMREQRAAERAEHSAQLLIEREQRDRIERDAEREKHAQEIKRLEDMFTSRESRHKPMPIAEMISAAVPFVPMFVALLTTRSSSESAAADRNARMIEAQLTSAKELMASTLSARENNGNSTADMLKTLIPLAIPLVTAFMTSNGPKAQAELVSAQSETQMMQLGMITQLLEQAKADGGGNEYIALAERVFEGLLTTAQAIAKTQQPKPAPIPVTVRQQTMTTGVPPEPQVTAQAEPQMTQGEQIANQVLAHAAFPAELRTQEWFTIVAMLHDKVAVDVIATDIATHLQNLDALKATPPLLTAVWSEPEATLAKVFAFLPVWQTDGAYARSVITKVVEILSAPDGEDDGEEEEEEEEAAVSGEASTVAAQ